MTDKKTYYEILHVQPDAPKEIIQSSYRTLMQQLNVHPDRGGDSKLAALINRAYAVLTDDSRRREYDRELVAELHEPASTATTGSYDMDEVRQQGGNACAFCGVASGFGELIPKDAFCKTCKSPLCPAEHTRLDETGQRKMTRIGKRSRLSYFTRWPQLRGENGTTENISQDGMMFVTNKRLPEQSIIKINGTQLLAVGRVVHCRQTGSLFDPSWHIGIEFVTLHLRSSRGLFVSDLT